MNPAFSRFLPLIIMACLVLAAGCAGTPSATTTAPKTTAVAGTPSAGTNAIILTGVPDVRQAEYYTCGASSLQAVLSYYGINSFETDLRTMVNTTASHGSYSWDIVRVAKQMGFDAEWKENLTLNDIESALKEGTPVIVRTERIKGTNMSWNDTWSIGHYMVVYGMDDRNVYLEDPYLLGSRLKMTRQDFVDSWHTYVSEIPVPSNAPKHYHEAIFICGKPPAEHPEFTGPLEWSPVVRPVVAQPPIMNPAETTQ